MKAVLFLARTHLSVVVVSLCLLSLSSQGRAQDAPDLTLLKATESVFTTRIREAEPSVVAIARMRTQSAIEVDPFRKPVRPDDAVSPNLIPNQFGTGVIIRENGLILTMYHLVRGGPTKAAEEGESQLVVRLNDRRSLRAYIHAADPRSDLAVLKIDANGLKPMAIDFDAELRKGQMVIGLGNPYAIARDGSPSASWGILSNIGRAADFDPPDDDDMSRHMIHHLGTLLHLDMRLDLGSSGSPILNLDGKLIGLTTSLAAIVGYEKSIGFAVPINPRFRRIIEDLVAGQEVGYGFLGINTPTEVSLEQLLRLPPEAPHRRGGATFSTIIKNTPAARGLQQEDVILELGYRPTGRAETQWTAIFDPNDLMREIALLPPGSEIDLKLWRQKPNSILTVPLTLGKWPVTDDEGIVAPHRPVWRGLIVDYTTARRKFMNNRRFGGPLLEVPSGVLVVQVVPGSPAARVENIQAGDVIQRVNRTAVTSPRQFYELLKDDSRAVTLNLWENRDVEVPPK